MTTNTIYAWLSESLHGEMLPITSNNTYPSTQSPSHHFSSLAFFAFVLEWANHPVQ